jgi:hypothetical protein
LDWQARNRFLKQTLEAGFSLPAWQMPKIVDRRGDYFVPPQLHRCADISADMRVVRVPARMLLRGNFFYRI